MIDKEKELHLANTKEYLRLIATFPRIGRPMAGLFISFNYFFHLNPLYKDRPDLKKYLDFFPLDLCIAVQPAKKTFLCINFHALPLRVRSILLNKLKQIYPAKFDQERVRIPGINYKKLFRLLKKIGISVRRYIFERVRKMTYIPGDQLDLALKYYTNTWYKTNITGITNRYNNFKPKIR
jgi:hypothetical protein